MNNTRIIPKKMKHTCPDGVTYEWSPRKANPVACPRCKYRLDFGQKS